MAIAVGDIYFSANFTDSGASGSDSFSFVTTKNIAAGEQIVFHGPESSGDTTFTYTVGAGGLSALDRVTIIEDASTSNSFILENDPSGGSVTDASGRFWSILDSDNIYAAQGGQVLAVIVNSTSSSSAWNDNIGVTGLSTTDLDAFLLANPTKSPIVEHVPGGSAGVDNVMFSGTDITTQGDNPAFWVGTDTPVDHTNPTVGATTYATQDADITCFTAGTLIATDQGETTVETLEIGDTLRTADGTTTTVLWIGRQTINKHRMGARCQPVRIKANALGNHFDLTVTADHGMIVDGYVINASALVNQDTIQFVPLAELADSFTIYHIETQNHDVILANGAPTETFIDVKGRANFDNHQEYLDLYGAERIIPELNLPRLSTARLLPARLQANLRQSA